MEGAIVVFGGSGHYGRHIVASLAAKKANVRVVSRYPAKAENILGKGVQLVQGDITEPASVARALADASAVVISISAMTPTLVKQARQVERDAVLALLRQAEKAGVRRVVYISVFDHQPEVLQKTPRPFRELTGYKMAVEAALARSSFNWTVLGAPPSYELFFALQRGYSLVVPGGGPPALPCISPQDVGEISAQAVLRDDLAGKRIRLVGPEVLSFALAVQRLSASTGREIRYRPIPLLPIRIASLLTLPFTPYLRFLLGSLLLLKNFPPELARDAPSDFQQLQETFDYTATSLEMEVQRRSISKSTL